MGRTVGSKNKLTIQVKDRIEWAFERLNGTDNAWLLKLAEENPAVFAGMVNRCIPTQAAVQVTHTLISIGDEMQQAANRLNAMRDARILEHDDTAHIHQPIDNIED